MTDEQKAMLAARIDERGIDSLRDSNWKQIEDENFHAIFKKYVDLVETLEEYIELDKFLQ